MAGSIEGQGLVARVTAALRYAMTGNAPTGWFGPLDPPQAQAPEEVRGRGWDYPVGANLNFRPRATEPTTFESLKQLASYPVVAMLIQRQKNLVAGQDWEIKPRKREGAEKAESADIKAITDFFQFPDKQHDWVQWIGAVLDQLLIIDAVSIYAAPNRAGGIYALQVFDGAVIKPVIDLGGRSPYPPFPAYQQILKGLPAVDYTTDELIYFPEVYRADKLYGYSRVEQAKDLISTAISRLRSQKSYFDYGNLGDGYFTAPEGWTPDSVRSLEIRWNNWMAGNIESRRQSQFLPSGTEWHETKVDLLEAEFDEFLIRLLCFPFGVAPTPFMKQSGLGTGSAKTDHEAAEEGGIAPLLQFVERLMSLIIAKWFKRPDLEFAFVDNREFDPKTAADIDDINLGNRSRTINEVRDRRGEPPVPWGDEPLVDTAGGVVPLSLAIERGSEEPAEPAPLDPAMGPQQGAKPAGVRGNAPVGGASEDDQKKSPDLAKAADPETVDALIDRLGKYLAVKGKAVADALADTLTKAADPDGFDGKVDAALDDVDWDWSDLPEQIEPSLAGIAVAAGNDAVSTLGLFDDAVLEAVTANAVAYARDRSAELVGMKWVDGELVPNPNAEWVISEATRDMIRKSVTRAMKDGLSNDDLRKTIMEDGAFSRSRADMIARTETAVADIRGAAIGWIESGEVHAARFDASPACCPKCQEEDGKIVPLAEPTDISLPHPRCRCSWSAVLKDD